MMSTPIPAFRRNFFAAAAWGPDECEEQRRQAGVSQPSRLWHRQVSGPQSGHMEPGTGLHRPNLRNLDLKTLPRDDGPPSETQLRREKFARFDKDCSQVDGQLGLFLSGDTVARDRDKLMDSGITHVLNCVGFVCKEYFKGELDYRTYYLQDTPAEDILCVLYDAFEFIDSAVALGGKVLVHCSQGVSRSATLVIAYLMWKRNWSFEQSFKAVKELRGVANPNIGFTCQLLQWQKRRRSPPAATRMYRLAPHCQHAPCLLVPRMVTPPQQYHTHTWRQLDPRGAFIIQTPNKLYTWCGSQCPPAYAEAATKAALLLAKYEGTQDQAIVACTQGSEPPGLRKLMDPPLLDPDAELQNARRASITGELTESALFNGIALSGPGQPSPMDIDSSESTAQQYLSRPVSSGPSNAPTLLRPPPTRGFSVINAAAAAATGSFPALGGVQGQGMHPQPQPHPQQRQSASTSGTSDTRQGSGQFGQFPDSAQGYSGTFSVPQPPGPAPAAMSRDSARTLNTARIGTAARQPPQPTVPPLPTMAFSSLSSPVLPSPIMTSPFISNAPSMFKSVTDGPKRSDRGGLVWAVAPVHEYTSDYNTFTEATKATGAPYHLVPGSDEALALAAGMRVASGRTSVTGCERSVRPLPSFHSRSGCPLPPFPPSLPPGGASQGQGGGAGLQAHESGSMHADGGQRKQRRGGEMFLSLHQSMDDDDMP